MDLSLQSLMALARYTVQNPREGARMVMQANVPVPARWMAFAVMAILSAVLAHLSFGMMPADMRMEMGGAMNSPFRTAAFQGALMLASVYAIVWIGRWRGGVGTFNDTLILMVWLQFILLILQMVQIVAQLVLPALSQGIGFLSIAVFLWLLTNFIAEVHKFASVGKTFVAVLLAMLAMGFVLTLILLPFADMGMN